MESKIKVCQKEDARGLCKCDKCRIDKADKWLLMKRPSLFSMCDQFRKAYSNDDQRTLEQLQVLLGHGRCLCCGYTLLHLAVNAVSKELVKYYLDRNADVEVTNDNGETALHLACAVDDCWFVEQLLINKADVNATDEIGCTPLQICLSRDKPSTAILKVLLDYGARPNKLFSFDKEAKQATESIRKMVKANARNSSGVLPLYEAIYKSDYVTTRQLLEDGACPDSLKCYRRSLLQVACFNKSVECAKALVNAGVDVNEADLEGRTALHYAVISECTEIAKLLLFHKCDLWVRDSDGYTALGMAALSNRWKMTNQLLNQGARCTEVLLMEVLERQCTEAALSILRRGYFRIHDTKFGRTLLYCAVATGQQEVVHYLQSVGVEVAYEGSDDDDDEFPLCSPLRSTEKSISPVSFVPNDLVATRSTDATRALKKRPYSSRFRETNAHSNCKQVRYSQSVDDTAGSKLRTLRQDRFVRYDAYDAPERTKLRHSDERMSRKSGILSCNRAANLSDKGASWKRGNAPIGFDSTKMSSRKSDSTTAVPDVQSFLKSRSKKSSKMQTENVGSYFHFYCRKELNSKMARTYEDECFDTPCKDESNKNVSSKVDTLLTIV